jgi:hypothetical protein
VNKDRTEALRLRRRTSGHVALQAVLLFALNLFHAASPSVEPTPDGFLTSFRYVESPARVRSDDVRKWGPDNESSQGFCRRGSRIEAARELSENSADAARGNHSFQRLCRS